ncbi:hypothetical protein WDW86_05745 [Bdellovibrionota bacterium FG-2]
MPKSFKEALLKRTQKAQKKIVAVRMPADIEEELVLIAKKSGKTVSQVIIEALRLALGIKGNSD